VIGICAAALALVSSPDIRVRAQDRDELARIFTARNAGANRIPPGVLEAHTEPLLAGPPGARWDLILSNIPAKTGKPVLEDFVSRSLTLLGEGGRVMLVAVHTLGDFFRSQINKAGAALIREEKGTDHLVFVYSKDPAQTDHRKIVGDKKTDKAVPAPSQKPAQAGPEPIEAGEGFLRRHPFYIRLRGDYEIEDTPLHLDGVHGASGFDEPGGAVLAAAKLVRRLGLKTLYPAPVLIHEGGQGFFPLWLSRYGEEYYAAAGAEFSPVLSGRNILALEAAGHNLRSFGKTKGKALLVPAADLFLDREKLRKASGEQNPEAAEGGYGFIAAFPESVPAKLLPSYWEAFACLLSPGGLVLTALPSSEAERLDRQKPPGFTRMGDLKRKGFRALAYSRR
jgi:hypothetical protein